ncbi:hypothetical protein ACFYKX_10060 [Cytobacillus sp. FJAT-54145]|uniref:DUF2726 domain-containing protein n=1 Tax=Cytobacillus spartinae TaxID=3299023 RepID=A0ABW6K9T9_9BACI
MGRLSLTQEEFKQRVKEAVGDEYVVMGEIKTTKEKVLMKHKVCGESWGITPDNFLNQGRRCPICAKKNATKSHEQFIQEVEKQGNGEYEVVGEYVNARTKVSMKHTVCGYVRDIRPDNFLAGTRCRKCSHQHKKKTNKKKTHEQFLQEVEEKFGKGTYQILEPYQTNRTLILVQHSKCGHEWSVRPNNFLSCSNPCPKCNGCYQPTPEEWEEEVRAITDGEYEAVSPYENSLTIVILHHKSCGTSFLMRPSAFRSGNRCTKCSKGIMSPNEWREFVHSTTNGEYEAVSDYKKTHQKVQIRHHKCGHVYPVRPADFKQGVRCPHCQEWKGEKAIRDYLTSVSIPFQKDHKFQDLYDKSPSHPLKFDVGIYDQPHFPIILAEYDGEQHTKEVEFFNGEEGYQDRRRKDKKKNQYALKHGIPLIRIPYTVKPEEVPQVLEQELHNLLSETPQNTPYLINPIHTLVSTKQVG